MNALADVWLDLVVNGSVLVLLVLASCVYKAVACGTAPLLTRKTKVIGLLESLALGMVGLPIATAAQLGLAAIGRMRAGQTHLPIVSTVTLLGLIVGVVISWLGYCAAVHCSLICAAIDKRRGLVAARMDVPPALDVGFPRFRWVMAHGVCLFVLAVDAVEFGFVYSPLLIRFLQGS